MAAYLLGRETAVLGKTLTKRISPPSSLSWPQHAEDVFIEERKLPNGKIWSCTLKILVATSR